MDNRGSAANNQIQQTNGKIAGVARDNLLVIVGVVQRQVKYYALKVYWAYSWT
jgi:hypothetical protein